MTNILQFFRNKVSNCCSEKSS